MADQLPKFEDQDLKAAVRQLRGGHQVRPELRALVVRRLAELRVQGEASRTAESQPPTRPPSVPSRPPWLRLRWLVLATAVLLMLGGVPGYLYYQRNQAAKAAQARITALMGEMVALHDLGRGDASGLEPLAAPLSDAKSLAAEAGSRLGRWIPVVDLGVQGWRLDAAGFCTVGTARSVRFHFTNGVRSISVISIPSSLDTRNEGGQFESVIGGHPVAGYARNGSLTYVVGDTVCGMGDTRALRDAIRGQ